MPKTSLWATGAARRLALDDGDAQHRNAGLSLENEHRILQQNIAERKSATLAVNSDD